MFVRLFVSEIRLGLNEDLKIGREERRAAYGSVVLDDCNFHEDTQLDQFERERIISMTAPVGEVCTPSLLPSLPPSLPPFFPPSFSLSLSLLTQVLFVVHAHSLTYSLTHSLTHSLTITTHIVHHDELPDQWRVPECHSLSSIHNSGRRRNSKVFFYVFV